MTRVWAGPESLFWPGGGAVAFPDWVEAGASPWKAAGRQRDCVCVEAGKIFTGAVGPGSGSLAIGHQTCFEIFALRQ